MVRDTGIGIAPEAQRADFPRVRAGRRPHRAKLWRHRPRPQHLRAHRQAHGRPHHAAERARRGLDLRGVDSARCRRRQGKRATGLRRARSDRSIDHAGGAAEHRGLADRAAAAALGRARPAWCRTSRWRRRCCRSGPGTPCCSTTPSAPATSQRWPRPPAPMRRAASCMFTPATRHELQSLPQPRLSPAIWSSRCAPARSRRA